jgi:hypothetical protein
MMRSSVACKSNQRVLQPRSVQLWAQHGSWVNQPFIARFRRNLVHRLWGTYRVPETLKRKRIPPFFIDGRRRLRDAVGRSFITRFWCNVVLLLRKIYERNSEVRIAMFYRQMSGWNVRKHAKFTQMTKLWSVAILQAFCWRQFDRQINGKSLKAADEILNKLGGSADWKVMETLSEHAHSVVIICLILFVAYITAVRR